MPRWTPPKKEEISILATYDFEWLKHFRCKNEKDESIFDQIPYSFGIYTEMTGKEIYEYHNRVENIL
jgi:hypothetical protein